MDKKETEELLDNIKEAAAYYQEILKHLMNSEQNKKEFDFSFSNIEKNTKIATKMLEQIIDKPDKFVEINTQYANKVHNLIFQSMQNSVNFQKINDEKEKSEFIDRRFRDPAWQQNAYFDFIKEYYLLTSDWMKQGSKQFDFDERIRRYIEFTTQQFIDAMSPTNFPFSNPEVIRESLDSNMENLVKGMKNLLEDIKKPDGMFNISTTDYDYFKLGKNLATTKGKVIYKNELVELICYEPKKKTYEVPIFIVPPWINKYYILDLSKKNSLVKWLNSCGYQVFLVSWINPNNKHSKMNFEDYIQKGIRDSCQEIKKLGYNNINAVGYCIGGTALTAALSIQSAKKENFIKSASFFATLIDFANPGEIGIFINEETLELVTKQIERKGYLHGAYLSNSFSMIRANDLVWSFFVNNYLLGKDPTAFDVLYWNSDFTNFSGEMYLYYLKNMYIENNLIKPNFLKMLGHEIDIRNIDVPTFSLAAKNDHISLWRSVYDGYRLIGSKDKIFCLTQAGHVAGIINPEGNLKYKHWISDDIKDIADSWETSAKEVKGSWWTSWNNWLQNHSGKKVDSINYAELDFIEMAPGSYVKRSHQLYQK